MQKGAMQSGSMLVKRKGRKMMDAILEGCTFMTPKRTKTVLLIINNTLDGARGLAHRPNPAPIRLSATVDQ